jgi:hypothetical protein
MGQSQCAQMVNEWLEGKASTSPTIARRFPELQLHNSLFYNLLFDATGFCAR